jgi:hypothetical protein
MSLEYLRENEGSFIIANESSAGRAFDEFVECLSFTEQRPKR